MIGPDPKPARRRRGGIASARGTEAEAIAAASLIAAGWAVLGRRVRTRAGEIDLVAEREGLLAFVEVKARPSFRDAAYALAPRQRARLLAAADIWMAMNPRHGAAGVRFDVLLVAADGGVRRIADAFRLGD